MQIKFNPTGTHVHKGYLKARFDLYPDLTDKTYALHYVQVPVFPSEGYQGAVDELGSPIDRGDFDRWLSRLPRIWQLNPCLCHFVAVPETIRLGDAQSFIPKLFDPATLATLDNALILPNSAHYVSPFMRSKGIPSVPSVKTKDIEDLVNSVNLRLGNLALSFNGGGSVIPIEPQSIDIGPGATDRVSYAATGTSVDKANPANAAGTIDTIEVWANTNLSSCEIATFFVVSGNNLSTRDYEAIGAVTAGSKHTSTGCDMDVETGDYLGVYYTAGRIEYSSSGGSGNWWKAATDLIPCTNYNFGTPSTTEVVSIYGTGTEAAAGAARGWWSK